MNRKKLIDTAEFMGVDVREAMTSRVKYLAEQRDSLLESIEKHEDEILFSDSLNDQTKAFLSLRVETDKKTVSKLTREIKAYTQLPREGEITDDMIAQAREYPIENLIEFRHGRCIAFCHSSDSYSMAKARGGNYAWCNVCQKAHNPIDVLMWRDGISFVEAVKQLN